jgi:hypothetical protein
LERPPSSSAGIKKSLIEITILLGREDEIVAVMAGEADIGIDRCLVGVEDHRLAGDLL